MRSHRLSANMSDAEAAGAKGSAELARACPACARPTGHRLRFRLFRWPRHMDHPWKIVPASLIIFQLRRMLGIGCARIASASRFGIPLNLFDAMRVVLRAP